LRDSIIIKKKLFKGSELEQVLSVIVLKHYQGNKLLELSHPEINQMRNNSRSKKKFTLCYTCLFHQQGTEKQLFGKRKYIGSYKIIRYYLINSLYSAERRIHAVNEL
jgi:hypothetical protein